MSRRTALSGIAGRRSGVRVEGFLKSRDRRTVRAAITAALQVLRAGRIEVDVHAVTQAHSRRLNRIFRGRRRPGDVLSFPLPSNAPGGPVGEMFLCPELVARGAGRHGFTPRRWLAYLAVHGMLHLFGFDHRTPVEARRMDGLTRALRSAGPRR